MAVVAVTVVVGTCSSSSSRSATATATATATTRGCLVSHRTGNYYSTYMLAVNEYDYDTTILATVATVPVV